MLELFLQEVKQAPQVKQIEVHLREIQFFQKEKRDISVGKLRRCAAAEKSCIQVIRLCVFYALNAMKGDEYGRWGDYSSQMFFGRDS
ncbi:MAG: hypothetical protein D3908_15910 [Candidatus Electrothrix sp. AUS4]|nr:hypothetical protein [Candidatus Electrothrix sp. AUS4]